MDDTRSYPADAQSLDATFRLLRHQRRRHVVAILADRTDPIGLRDLAAAVAAREAGTDSDAASDRAIGDDDATSDDAAPDDATDDDTTDDDAIAEMVATLHHNHVPKLADAGVVAYDAEARTVTPIRTAGLLSLVSTVGDGDR